MYVVSHIERENLFTVSHLLTSPAGTRLSVCVTNCLQILQDLGILKNARAVLVGRQRPMSGIKMHRYLRD